MKSNINSIISSVQREGFHVLSNYLSEEECNRAIKEIDSAIESNLPQLWKGSLEADKRLFGIEKKSTIAEKFLNDDSIYEILLKLNKTSALDKTILGAKLDAVEGNLGSGEGWHRDDHNADQFKAILYLTDVDVQNGPFQLLENSHLFLKRLWLHFRHHININKTRFKEEREIKKIESLKTKIFCERRGSLIIANTRGIHRGMPILSGTRYAMTIYNWPKGKFPPHIKKLTLT